MSKLAALLLAGGASVRMGRQKASLDFGGTPLWRHQLDTLMKLEPDELYISGSPALDLPSGPWKILYDEQPGLGPLSGLTTALHASTATQLVVLAVDLPNVTPEFLQLLLAQADPDGGIVPELDAFYQGTVAVYPRRLLPACEQILGSHDRSFQRLVRQGLVEKSLKVYPVGEAERPLFLNLNTPEDFPVKEG